MNLRFNQFCGLANAHNQIFFVEFIKRSDGSLRKMLCRTGVGGRKDNIKGSTPAPWSDHDLLVVFDMQAKGFRSIPVDGIVRISIKGRKYVRSAFVDLFVDVGT